jgi:hypothetical protein
MKGEERGNQKEEENAPEDKDVHDAGIKLASGKRHLAYSQEALMKEDIKGPGNKGPCPPLLKSIFRFSRFPEPPALIEGIANKNGEKQSQEINQPTVLNMPKGFSRSFQMLPPA